MKSNHWSVRKRCSLQCFDAGYHRVSRGVNTSMPGVPRAPGTERPARGNAPVWCHPNKLSIARLGHHAAIVRIDQQVDIVAVRRLGIGAPQAMLIFDVMDLLVARSNQLGVDFILVEL